MSTPLAPEQAQQQLKQIRRIVAELMELRGKATRGPWELGNKLRECDGHFTSFTEGRNIYPPLGEAGPVAECDDTEENGAFIVAMANRLPEIAAALEQLSQPAPVQIDPANPETLPARAISKHSGNPLATSPRVLVALMAFDEWFTGITQWDYKARGWADGGTWTHWTPLPNWSLVERAEPEEKP